MVKIDEYFEKYPENIIGFRVNKTTKIVDVWLNTTWVFPKQPDGVSVKKQKTSEDTIYTYYIIYSEIHDFGFLYESISNIIEHNLDIERKSILFKDRVTELKNLFTSLPYEELKAIKFEAPYTLRTQQTDADVDNTLKNETIEQEVINEIKNEEDN
jgi:hypothetical protein